MSARGAAALHPHPQPPSSTRRSLPGPGLVLQLRSVLARGQRGASAGNGTAATQHSPSFCPVLLLELPSPRGEAGSVEQAWTSPESRRHLSAPWWPLRAHLAQAGPRGCVAWVSQSQATWVGFENSTPPHPPASHRYRAASQSPVCELWPLTCLGLRVLICEECSSKAPRQVYCKAQSGKLPASLRTAKSLVMSSLSNYHR